MTTTKTFRTFFAATFALVFFANTALAQPYIEDETASFTISPATSAEFSAAQWQSLGDLIEAALHHDNAGVRSAAMRAMIQYASNFDVSRDAVLTLTRRYRNDENQNTRRMAVVALGATDDVWAIDFLKRSLAYEKSPAVKHTVASVLIEAGAIGFGPARKSN
jgi:hypothetical protein